MRKIEYRICYYDSDYYEVGASEKQWGYIDYETEEAAEEEIMNANDPYSPRELYIKKVYVRK